MAATDTAQVSRSDRGARIGVVGATGAVGSVTLGLLAERGYENVRALASARSAGGRLRYGDEELEIEEDRKSTRLNSSH